MRTASLVLGIVGGIIAILYGLILILGGSILMSSNLWENAYDEWSSSGNWSGSLDSWDTNGDWGDGGWEYHYHVDMPEDVPEWVFTDVIPMGGGIVIGGGILAAVAGIVGIIGGSMAKKRNVAAGIMMIVAGALCMVAFFNFVSLVMLVLGGIFALIKEKQKPAAQYPPAPSYPYGQYPPYPPYQQPYQPQQAPPESPENPPEQQ